MINELFGSSLTCSDLVNAQTQSQNRLSQLANEAAFAPTAGQARRTVYPEIDALVRYFSNLGLSDEDIRKTVQKSLFARLRELNNE